MDTIHFCIVNAAWLSNQALDKTIGCFSRSERKHYSKLAEARQREFAISRLLLRLALSQQHPVPFTDWNLEERNNDTPIILNESWNGYISITHSPHFIACALSTQPVGIDIEEHRAIDNLEKMSARVFTNEQQKRLQKSDKEHRAKLFLQYWTYKEALFKACSSAGSPIQFMRNTSAVDTGFHTGSIATKRLFAALATKQSFDNFTVHFWKSPQQRREITLHPNA